MQVQATSTGVVSPQAGGADDSGLVPDQTTLALVACTFDGGLQSLVVAAGRLVMNYITGICPTRGNHAKHSQTMVETAESL